MKSSFDRIATIEMSVNGTWMVLSLVSVSMLRLLESCLRSALSWRMVKWLDLPFSCVTSKCCFTDDAMALELEDGEKADDGETGLTTRQRSTSAACETTKTTA